MHLVSPCGVGTNRDEIIQLSPFQNDQGRHDLRKTGGRHSLPGIMFIEHTTTFEFLEQNAMGWRDTPRRELVRNNRRSDLYGMSGYALCVADGRSNSRGTDQEETNKHLGCEGEKSRSP